MRVIKLLFIILLSVNVTFIYGQEQNYMDEKLLLEMEKSLDPLTFKKLSQLDESRLNQIILTEDNLLVYPVQQTDQSIQPHILDPHQNQPEWELFLEQSQNFNQSELIGMYNESAYNDLTRLLSHGNRASSLAPGNISGVDSIPENLKSQYTEMLARIQGEWSKDPCNDSRNDYNRMIEEKISKAFLERFKSPETYEYKNRHKYQMVTIGYDEDCLQPVLNLPDEINERLVMIVLNETPFCGGFRLSKFKIVTSRHCFFNQDYGTFLEYAEDYEYEEKFNDITVSLLSDPLSQFKISKLDYSNPMLPINNSFGIEHDYVFLTIRNQSGLSDPDSVSVVKYVEDPVFHEPLVFVGYYLFHNSSHIFNISGNYSHWYQGLRRTKGDYCRVFDVSQNAMCVAHGCQSTNLFSGGPIVSEVMNENQDGLKVIRFLGVHSRDGVDSQGCGTFKSKNEISSAVGLQGGLALGVNQDIINGGFQ